MNVFHSTTLRLASLLALSAGSLLAAGCGTGTRTNAGNGDGGDTPTQTVVETLVLTIKDGMPPELAVTCAGAGVSFEQLQVQAFCQNVGTGKQREVTTSANLHWKSGNSAFLVVNDTNKKGLVQAKCLLPHGGLQYVTAEGECGRAAQPITFKYTAPPVYAQNAPIGAENAFMGQPSPNVADQPQIVYPIDGAMHASNIGQITVQWKTSVGQQLFRWHLVGANIDADFYVGAQGLCTPDPADPKGLIANCAWSPPADKWRTVTESMRGGQITLTITGTTGFNQLQADSPPITLAISPESVRGGLYYFSPTTQGLKRIPFGAPFATDFIKGGDNTDIKCVGCHAISPDGKKVAATFYGADGLGGIVDANNGNKFLAAPLSSPIKRWNFATFSPDGKLLLTNWAGVLTLRDGTTGAKKFDIDPKITGGKAIQPDWSPDGQYVAFVQVPSEGKLGKDFVNTNLQAGDWVAANTGNIAVMQYERGAFSPAKVVVPANTGTEYHYFPSFSPDSNFILFVSGAAPGSSSTAWKNVYGQENPRLPVQGYANYMMTYDQDTARLRLVSVGGGNPIELTQATHQMGMTASWPRFSPFKQGNIAFFTFSAKFPYGFVVTDGKTPQMWMSAVDLGRAAADQGATDPSYPPVWLPFQSSREKNHSGIWTQEITCVSNDDCGEGFICTGGFCKAVTNG